MKKRRRIALVATFVALLVANVFGGQQPDEPRYEGKRLREWLVQLIPAPLTGAVLTAGQKEQTVNALRHMGTNALTYLINLLTAKPESSWMREKIAWLNAHQKILKIPLRDRPDWPSLAMEAFRLLGRDAAPAIPKLAKLLEQQQTDYIACECLHAIGPPALPTFIAALTNRNARIRGLVLQEIGDFGPAAREAIPIIAEIARGAPADHAGTAVRVLSEVGTNAARFLPLFAHSFADPNLVFDAAFALGRIGSPGVPILLQALTNQDKRARQAAIAALQPQIGEPGPNRASNPPDYSFRAVSCIYNGAVLMAAWTMYNTNDAALVVSAIARNLRHAEPDLKVALTRYATKYGLQSIPVLSTAAADESEAVRHIAESAMEALGVETRLGGIVRGPRSEKKIALVFTGHEFGDGGEIILDQLARLHAKAAFFLTGDFLNNPAFQSFIRRITEDGHYLGPHSDKHLLYCSWETRRELLVTHWQFQQDLMSNLQKIQRFGNGRRRSAESLPELQPRPFGFNRTIIRFFLPPYEHYNLEVAEWSARIGFTLINFTPGTRSNADYTGEADTNFVSSQTIFDSIVTKEREDPHGLNGFILLLHLGSGPGRADKFHTRFGELLDYLAAKGYQFVRVDELLEPPDAWSKGGSLPKP